MNLSIRSCLPQRTIHVEPIIDEHGFISISNGLRMQRRISFFTRLQGYLEALDFYTQLYSLPEENDSYENCSRLRRAYFHRSTYLNFQSGNVPDLLNYSVFRNFLYSLTIHKTDKIPNSVFTLNNLITLEIHQPNFSYLPDEIENLTALRALIIYCHRFKQLPKTIGNLTNLELLTIVGSLENNSLSFPTEIKKLKKLKRLVLASNNLSSLPEQILPLRLTRLDLSENQLESLPDDIGTLKCLKILNLSHNLLRNLPNSISQLKKLEEIHLNNNCLSLPLDCLEDCSSLKIMDLHTNNFREFPFKIKNQSVKWLDISYNHITHIPVEINTLIQLEGLICFYNSLTTIPDINHLQNLRKIDLSRNELISLPNIDNLPHLNTLDVTSNTHLDSLPLSLGNCSQLCDIGIDNTAIPYAQKRAILDRAKRIREGQTLTSFPIRVDSWKAYSAKTLDLAFLFDENNFPQEQQFSINEWLLRLETTKEFQRSRGQLAVLVCDIMDSLRPSAVPEAIEFKNAFFGHLDGNLVNCGDRAAMLLNLIYIDWQLLMIDKNSSDKQKMELLIGIAKTQTLRKILQKKLIELRSNSILGVVETYLYYETHLKEVLGLVTAVSSMLYADIGRISTIDNSELIRDVNAQYTDTLCELPGLDSILEKNHEYLRAKEQIITSTEEEMGALDDKEWSQEGEYMKAMNDLKENRESEILTLKKRFL